MRRPSLPRSRSNSSIDWKRSQFAAYANQLNPNGAFSYNAFYVSAEPPNGCRELVDVQGIPNYLVAYATSDTLQTDLAPVTFSVGNPYPSAWLLRRRAMTRFGVPFTLGGLSMTSEASIESSADVDAAPTLVAPGIGVVTTPTVNGRGAFGGGLDMGTSPILSWMGCLK